MVSLLIKHRRHTSYTVFESLLHTCRPPLGFGHVYVSRILQRSFYASFVPAIVSYDGRRFHVYIVIVIYPRPYAVCVCTHDVSDPVRFLCTGRNDTGVQSIFPHTLYTCRVWTVDGECLRDEPRGPAVHETIRS